MVFSFKNKTMATAVALALIGISAMSLTSCNQQTANGGQNSQNSSQDPLTSIQPVVEKSSRGQFRAVKIFDGPDKSGMKGVLLEGQGGGQKMIAWMDKDGNYLMPGPLFNKDGENLSEKYLNDQAGYITPAKLADQVAGQGFMAGKSGPVMTIFFEPYCGYCNKLFENIKPLVDSGKMRARIIMVGFLRPDSLARAADIQNAKDPWKAMKNWEGLADKSKAPASTSTPEEQAKIQGWNTLMNSAGQTGTPAILYCNKQTKQVEMSKGMPPDFNSFFANVGSEGNDACGWRRNRW